MTTTTTTTKPRIISQAEARRLAKAWGARLPVGDRVLWRNATAADCKLSGGMHCLYRNTLNQWVLALCQVPSLKETAND